jgi:CxxC motif-containing protein (DUF1111 family)
LAIVVYGLTATGCDLLFTGPPSDPDVFDAPVDGLTPEQLAVFARGDAEFGRRFSVVDGLGPIFNDASCASCHSGDGRGRPENILLRISRAGDPAVDVGGPQIQDRAIPGAIPETLPPGVDISPRLPPPVFGVGLIEAIPTNAILANADEFDADGDGISGRPHWVTLPPFVPLTEPGAVAGLVLGRFSRKAQVGSLLQQVVEAYHQDIGITTDFLPHENVNPQSPNVTQAADQVADPELAASTVFAVLDYVRMLTSPAPADDAPELVEGAQLFRDVGCADCHIPTFTTGAHRIAALADREVVLYSDLLLHDMGEQLADNRPDGDATGREWRTTPLWGLRIAPDFLDGQMFLMHDGRARTIEEAVLLHGGEAEASRVAFMSLPLAHRDALLEFVRTR